MRGLNHNDLTGKKIEAGQYNKILTTSRLASTSFYRGDTDSLCKLSGFWGGARGTRGEANCSRYNLRDVNQALSNYYNTSQVAYSLNKKKEISYY